MNYIVNVVEVFTGEPHTIIAENTKQLTELLLLAENSKSYEVLEVASLPINHDYVDFIEELRNDIKPEGLNFG